MAITKAEYADRLDFLVRLNRDSVTTRMHIGYGGAVQTTFDRMLTEIPPRQTRSGEEELRALVGKAKEAWFVRGVNLPFITTSIKEQATASIETFLSLAQQCLAEKF